MLREGLGIWSSSHNKEQSEDDDDSRSRLVALFPDGGIVGAGLLGRQAGIFLVMVLYAVQIVHVILAHPRLQRLSRASAIAAL